MGRGLRSGPREICLPELCFNQNNAQPYKMASPKSLALPACGAPNPFVMVKALWKARLIRLATTGGTRLSRKASNWTVSLLCELTFFCLSSGMFSFICPLRTSSHSERAPFVCSTQPILPWFKLVQVKHVFTSVFTAKQTGLVSERFLPFIVLSECRNQAFPLHLAWQGEGGHEQKYLNI